MSERIDELIELDCRGFLLPPECEPDQHLENARRTLEWADGVRRDLEREGRAEIMGAEFEAEQRLPENVMDECLTAAQDAYAIRPDWVPAFYSNSYLPWYVGGASFYGSPEGVFRVCFLLRESFRNRRRWLIYDRSEIASHETCHVARAAFAQPRFEEPLAYAISASAMRRVLGGMFNGRWEAPAFLISSLLLVGGSVMDMIGYPSWVRLLSALPLAVIGSGLGLRAALTYRDINRARRFLQQDFPETASAILFRCSDREIGSLAGAEAREISPIGWMQEQPATPRWELIRRRFAESP